MSTEGYPARLRTTAGSRSEQDEGGDEVALSKRLYSAIEHGDLDRLEALVDKGVDVSGRTSVFDKTPLHWAAFFKQEAVAQYLVDKGALIEALDAEERTPLHMAALEGSLEILEIFLRAGASVNKKDRAGKSAIHDAAEKGDRRDGDGIDQEWRKNRRSGRPGATRLFTGQPSKAISRRQVCFFPAVLMQMQQMMTDILLSTGARWREGAR